MSLMTFYSGVFSKAFSNTCRWDPGMSESEDTQGTPLTIRINAPATLYFRRNIVKVILYTAWMSSEEIRPIAYNRVLDKAQPSLAFPPFQLPCLHLLALVLLLPAVIIPVIYLHLHYGLKLCFVEGSSNDIRVIIS